MYSIISLRGLVFVIIFSISVHIIFLVKTRYGVSSDLHRKANLPHARHEDMYPKFLREITNQPTYKGSFFLREGAQNKFFNFLYLQP